MPAKKFRRPKTTPSGALHLRDFERIPATGRHTSVGADADHATGRALLINAARSPYLERHAAHHGARAGRGSKRADHPFELEAVWNDRHNYELTTRNWARNLDANADEIERRWGRALYRTFRLYLWGCADGFYRDLITAYRWVLRLKA